MTTSPLLYGKIPLDQYCLDVLKQSPLSRTLVFHTYGDVTLEKFYRAVAFLLTDTPVMVVTVPTLDVHTMRFLRQCFDRCWVSNMIITTATDMTAFVESDLADHLAHVHYVHSKYINDTTCNLTLFSDSQALIINGNLPLTARQDTLSIHTMIYQPRRPTDNVASDIIADTIDPIITLHRQDKAQTARCADRLKAILDRYYK